MDAHALRRPGAPFGPLLEGFVGAEISRQLTWSAERAQLYHYRDRNKVEVDLVIENRHGQVVAVEVKAASTVRTEDFRGLRHLAERLGEISGSGSYSIRATRPCRSVLSSARYR